MKSLSENIFLKAPVFLQNTALALYGLKLIRIRHGGDYKNFLDQIKYQRQVSYSDIKDHVNITLRKTIKDAVQNVPYYIDLFKKKRLVYDDIKTVEDLKIIPLLEKTPVRKDPLRFANKKYDKKKLLCIHTTGTTGTPLNIFCNNSARQRNYAFYDYFLKENGIDFMGKRATFGGRIIVSPRQKKPPFWRYSYFQKNMLFSSYHLTEENIPYYIKKLARFKPNYIDAYPSSLYTIARFAQEYNLDLKNITNGITTSAETLLSDQRETIETVFGVPVTDQYGAAEMCIFVGQCREGNYHIHSDYAAVEFLREDGTQARIGEEAEIVCTGLINPVMPLIRYRIGDRGILSDKKCKCGSHFPVMEKIIGRMDDVIITPDGRRVGRLSPVLKGFPVKEVQYIQKSKDSVDVVIVKDNGYTNKTDKDVINELAKRLGHEIMINIKHTQAINRGYGGKLKTVISYINR